MKFLLVFVFFFSSSHLYSQVQLDHKLSGVTMESLKKYKETDTIPKVIYLEQRKRASNPALFLNGKHMPMQLINTINPNQIQEVNVEKEDQKIDSIEYHGSIHVKLKASYQGHFISLNELKLKYIKDSSLPTLFFLNKQAIHDSYDDYLVDEKYILKIEVDQVKNPNEGLDLNIVRLITRTKRNLDTANAIRLRGVNHNLD